MGPELDIWDFSSVLTSAYRKPRPRIKPRALLNRSRSREERIGEGDINQRTKDISMAADQALPKV
jgi:hypothetical protein